MEWKFKKATNERDEWLNKVQSEGWGGGGVDENLLQSPHYYYYFVQDRNSTIA